MILHQDHRRRGGLRCRDGQRGRSQEAQDTALPACREQKTPYRGCCGKQGNGRVGFRTTHRQLAMSQRQPDTSRPHSSASVAKWPASLPTGDESTRDAGPWRGAHVRCTAHAAVIKTNTERGPGRGGAGAGSESTEPACPRRAWSRFSADVLERYQSRPAIRGLWESEGLLRGSLACGRNGPPVPCPLGTPGSLPRSPTVSWLAGPGVGGLGVSAASAAHPVWPWPQMPPQLHEGGQRPSHENQMRRRP